jgi:triphosphoribosyl-dephospho-CoA synthase
VTTFPENALQADIAAAFVAACGDELDAPKPGNVHRFAADRRKTVSAFIRSAEVAAPALAMSGATVGARILGAVEATAAAVGSNTNLGIILLCAPLAAAAETRPADLRAALIDLLGGLDVEDARLAFRAIALAAPGGLGSSERHDVRQPATVTLRQAMAEAAHRDRIASQYASGFHDVFAVEETLRSDPARFAEPRWATLDIYLEFLAAFPDSHIVREHGICAAEPIRLVAQGFLDRLRTTGDPAELLTDLLAWDRRLKDRGHNPGTSADLTVAALFVRRLRNILPSTPNSG